MNARGSQGAPTTDEGSEYAPADEGFGPEDSGADDSNEVELVPDERSADADDQPAPAGPIQFATGKGE